ncbi:hypothetical protein [Halalkalibacter nanhaiisediminis]|uniref:Uncharacterized protein n=1 Tax=Halalkalibacter nanhaiisediminis TaxID=688079 RepID=A0A562QMV8_9BACI|nr:hypothetical protein [Halalkalibacter nanhaiisediminis]TWI58013.1 hypothetical protein IQ10_01344 [Halalkalibacter nanhaiisediminis]
MAVSFTYNTKQSFRIRKRRWRNILETLFGIIIVLFILAMCFLMMYWGGNQIYKTTLKPKINSDTELRKELDTLKKRVELLKEN